MAERIGIWGGTFDPVHSGHLSLAEQLRRGLEFDRMVLMPAKLPPHRPAPSAAEHRLAMLHLALTDYPALALDTRELEREGLSYSVITCREFRREYPGAAIFWCMGFDAFTQFHTWHCWREILTLVNIAVVARPGFGGKSFESEMTGLANSHGYCLAASDTDYRSGSVVSLALDLVDISSSQVRRNIREQRPSTHLSPAVWQYIQQHHLYRL